MQTKFSLSHDIEEAALSDHVVLLSHINDEDTPEVLTPKKELEQYWA